MQCSKCGRFIDYETPPWCLTCGEVVPGRAGPAWHVVRPIGGLGTALVALLFTVIVVDALSVAALIMRHRLIQRAIDDPAAVTDSQLVMSDNITGLARILPFVAFVVTGVVFLVWFYRARVNAEAYGTVPQRLGKGWAIGAWFCPFVNLWFPKQMTDDIWSASEPASTSAEDGQSRLSRRHAGLVLAWWLAWLVALVLARAAGPANHKTLEDLRDYADMAAVAAAVDLVAAVLAILVVRRISGFQRLRESHPQPIQHCRAA